MEEYFLPLVKLLKEQRLDFKRTIIFCQRQLDCGHLYQLFEKCLESALSDPVGTPISFPEYRLVNVYTKGTEYLVKDTVIHEMTQ